MFESTTFAGIQEPVSGVSNKNDSKSLNDLNNNRKNNNSNNNKNTKIENDEKSRVSTNSDSKEPALTSQLVAKDVIKEKKVKLKSYDNIQFLNDGKTSEYKNSSLSVNSNKDETNNTRCSKIKSECYNYSYIVLFASFISFMLASILSCCFGVFFESMEHDMGWSKSQVAFIGGFISALQDLCGPVASALTNRFGCRKTCMFGGLMAGLGLIGNVLNLKFYLLTFFGNLFLFSYI